MSKYIILSILILLYSCKTSTDEEAIKGIQKNFEQQTKAWNQGNLSSYIEAYTSDGRARTISRAGVTQGKDNILKEYQKYYNKENMGTLRFDHFTYDKLRNDLYYVVGRFNLTYPTKDHEPKERHGWFSVLMHKKEDNWFILSDHSS